MSFINSYVTIRDFRIVANHQLIFDGSQRPLRAFADDAYDHLRMDYPKFYKMDRLSALGILASEILLKGRSLASEYDPGRVAVILSNKHSSLDTDLRYYETTKAMASPALFVYTLPNIMIGEICIRHGFKGENTFFIFDEFNPGFLSNFVEDLFERNIADACIAGWSELLEERHDFFLYLTEKESKINSLDHSTENLIKLYRGE